MNIAFYLNNSNHNETLDLIKNFYLEEDRTINFFLTYHDTDRQEKHSTSSMALVNFYYVRFMKGKVVFTKIEDFLEVENFIIGQPVLAVEEKLLKSIRSKHLRKFKEILIITNKTIERINHQEL